MFSSLLLRSSICLAIVGSVSALTGTTYQLDTSYSGDSFFDGFNFFNLPDPTNGFVNYVDQNTAQTQGLISSGAGSAAYMGVDFSTTLSGLPNTIGRNSVRIESKKSFTHGLIISDIAHMPGGICGTWPAHWTLGSGQWPLNGEIDIIEGANSATTNLMSMHTTPGCTIAGANEIGTLQTSNCDASVNFNSGCGVTSSTSASYGTGFNAAQGGVYATQWTSDYVRIWFFQRGSIPADISSGSPNPALWGEPQANFQGSCDIDSKLNSHRIIFDTTFCGDYAGSIWGGSTCSASNGPSCVAYVAGNPTAFKNAYWSINSVKVYQLVDSSGATTSLAPAPTTLNSVKPQSSIFAPGMGVNGSSSTVSLTSVPYAIATSAPSAINLAKVNGFSYIGCASTSTAFATFTQVEDSPNMSIERCTLDCAGYTYAGVFNSLCFCANTLDSASGTSASNTCNTPCPGAAGEICGGSAIKNKLARRQASNAIFLSLYINTSAQAGSSGVHFGVSVNVNVDVLVSVTPAFSVFGYGMGGGAPASALSNVVVSTTYVDVCTVCAGGYTTLTTTVTLQGHCGCVAGLTTTTPSVPMATLTKTCNVCKVTGGPGKVTVTLPDVVAIAAQTVSRAVVIPVASPVVINVSNGTAIGPGVAKFTGSAAFLKANAGLLVAFVGALAIL